MADSPDKIAWHPGFYGAAEVELKDNKDDLIFEREYNLSKEPLRADLLIIRKNKDAVIVNEIGRIFRRFNIVEYKSPEDSLTIDDLYKTIGYACLYKGMADHVNEVPAVELTVSLFRESYPSALFSALSELGCSAEEKYPGIYYVSGNLLFPVQIVVTRQLFPETHSSLRVLSINADEEDIIRFLNMARLFDTPGDRNNADAIIQVSATANRMKYDKIKEDSEMCQALRDIMKDELNQAHVFGVQQGSINSYIESVKGIVQAFDVSAEKAVLIANVPEQYRQAVLAKV